MNFSSVEDLTCEYSERTLKPRPSYVLPYHQCSVLVYMHGYDENPTFCNC